MISYLSNRKKGVAAFLFGVFYLGTVLPAWAMNGRPSYTPLRGAGVYYAPLPAVADDAPTIPARHYNLPPAHAPGLPVVANSPALAEMPLLQTGKLVAVSAEDDKTTNKNTNNGEAPKDEGPGPGQPEMQAFKAVSSSDMVDLFTGDFSYNIPLMDVGGYPINLSYGGGVTMDQEASWVGLGWSVNPGAVNRNVRGLPDDFKGGADGDQITKTMSVKENRTIGGELSGDLELIGKEIQKPQSKYSKDSSASRPGTAGLTIGAFYNSYKGWGTETGINFGLNAGRAAKGKFAASFSMGNNSQNGFSVNNNFSYQLEVKEWGIKHTPTLSTGYNSRTGLHNLQLSGQMFNERLATYSQGDKENPAQTLNTTGGYSVSISFAKPTFTPSIQMPYTSSQFSIKVKAGLEQMALHPNLAGRFYVNRQFIEAKNKIQQKDAYGYLYMQDANANEGVLLDYNRDKDLPLTTNSIVVGMPAYANDVFSVSGQGTGGMFKAYRGDAGYVYDHAMRTHSGSQNYSIDLGFGNLFHGGLDVSAVVAWSRSGMWKDANYLNDQLEFAKKDSSFEPVYFKNPGEKGAVDEAFYNAMGGDELVRANLTRRTSFNVPTAARSLATYQNGQQTGTVAINSPIVRKQRDKRTQVISYLSAGDATEMGLEKTIRSYAINSFPKASCVTNYEMINRVDAMRKKHHIGEVTVLGPNGGRYVYGIPVYNISQKDVTFASPQGNATDLAEGLVTYNPGVDNSTQNSLGQDNFFMSEQVPSNAHSYLLTSVLSADYVDVKGDGITDDDMGDAVKINYSRVYGGANGGFSWRAPYAENRATYNPGLKTDNRDERGTYAYGEKEIWYLNSVESKNMMATFVVDVANTREDDYGVKGENGGRNAVQKLYRLKEINLYTKVDYIKSGAAAKPIKTVHFEYDYSLCSGNPASSTGGGKLTLRKVWFSYNKNYKGQRNPFQFWYHNNNPAYNTRSNDRWGTYKNQNTNPGTGANQLTNADYPYTVQGDSATAAFNAGAWLLDSIKLPSGGRMKVTYESDDYAFVQNKRAMQFCSIAGFGASATDAALPDLYPNNAEDYQFVFVNVPAAIVNNANAALAKREIYDKYLEGVNMLHFKLWVKMPDSDNRYGSGYEMVPGYATIIDYGVKAGSSGQQIWIRVKPIVSERILNIPGNVNRSPFATQAVQFLRHNLSYKAHPNSEIGDKPSAKEMIQSFGTVFANVKEGIYGFTSLARKKGWCKTVLLSNSFIRLNNPSHQKLGGGHRVKKVVVYDNWNAMSGKPESVYGQQYDYSTTRVVNGVNTRISSGVAAYEPMTGSDENPFRVPLNNAIHHERNYPLGPADYQYVEGPVGEGFYPGPSVGYSKVTVTSIHSTKKSSNGTSVSEYFTAYDFPAKTDFTPLEKNKSRIESKSGLLKIIGWSREMATVSQGFRVDLNDMHGRMKAQYVYPQTDPNNPTSYTLNYYKLDNDLAGIKKLNNTVQMADSANGTIRTGIIGKDIELMTDFRQQESFTISGNVQFNFDHFIAGIFPAIIPSVIPVPKFEQNRYRAVTMTKVINRYALLDSVVVNDKGSIATTRNMVYDAETGDVLLTRTNNEFNDYIFNFSYPAHWAYSGMGGAYKNIDAVYSNLVVKKGKVFKKGGQPLDMARYFESGDELMVTGKDGVITAPATDPCAESDISYAGSFTNRRLWVLNAAKAREGNPGYFLADVNGKYFTGEIKQLRILRSGKRNLMATPVGSITALNNPVQNISGKDRLVFDANTGVVAAGAAKFKDVWPTENRLREKDSCVTVVDTIAGFFPAKKILTQKLRTLPRRSDEMFSQFDDKIVASYHGRNNGKDQYKTRSLIKYDLSSIPANATIILAQMNLRGKTPNNLWNFSPWWDAGFNYSYDGLPERIEGIISRYRVMPWDGTTTTPMWDYSNNVDNRVKTQINHVPVIGTQNFLNVDVTGVINEMRALPANQQTIEMRLRQDYREPGQNLNQIKFMSFKRLSLDFKESFDSTLFIKYLRPLTNCFKVCISELDGKDTINPYVYGIWGNWRGDRAYTYYNDRKESDPTVVTNIRKDGQIANFAPYWSFVNNNYLQASTDETRWVWNSEIKMMNRKGFDIENRDPLNRHNAGLYGYRQHLPVAVGQNTKQRELAFDGFEDYDYETDTCLKCRQPLWIDPAVHGGARVQGTAHSGRYSFRVYAGQNVSIPVGLVTPAQDSLAANISIAYDTLSYNKTTINGSGTGLLIRYNQNNTWLGYSEYGNVNKNWGPGAPPTVSPNYFYAEWTGKVQPRYSGAYTFYTRSDDMIRVFVNGQQISKDADTWRLQDGSQEYATYPITLTAGQLYDIKVQFIEHEGQALAQLSWESSLQGKEIVPLSQLYPPTVTTPPPGTIVVTSEQCVKPRHPKPENLLLPKFSPINGKKMVVGAWVREQTLCNDKYVNVQMTLTFNDGANTTKVLKPTGLVIEGWQRIEEFVDIPATGTLMTIQLQCLSGTAYFDDVRLHPYNSNMKSFVYDPLNLRLMAELDENNYAAFYEYDDDGTLIRVKKETERGIKTIQETRSALRKE
jgi:hypothetical protein